jgi:hypothetical protein
MSGNLYRVFHLNRFVKSFTDREAALAFVYGQRTPEDWEILDKSDELAGN